MKRVVLLAALIIATPGCDSVDQPPETLGLAGTYVMEVDGAGSFEGLADGSVTFYTRGVDRITTEALTRVNQATPGGTGAWGRHTDGAVFSGGDNLWQSFQERIEQRINQRGGSAQAVEPVTARISWDRVDDVLLGRESVRAFFDREARR